MQAIAGTRASDAERERAVAALRRHYAEGRLGADELEERTTHAYVARTRGELAALLADLPFDLRRAVPRGAIGRAAARAHRFMLRGHAATYAGVNGTLIGLWAVTGEGTFWPALYLVPSTALLGWHWAGGRMLARAFSRWHAPGSHARSRPRWR
jgi:hypothetical protein